MTEPEKNAPKKNAPAEATPAPPSFTPAPVVPDAPEPARAGPPAATIVALVVLLAGLIWLWRQDTGLRHRLDAVQAQLAAAQTVDPARVSAVEWPHCRPGRCPRRRLTSSRWTRVLRRWRSDPRPTSNRWTIALRRWRSGLHPT
jgi:hypothetical protein